MYKPTDQEMNKLKGMFFGLAVGDALGTTLEFKERDEYEHLTDMVGGGPFNLKPGEWTDDTSMALALAKTLIDNHVSWAAGNEEEIKTFRIELLKNFTRWYRQGMFSHNGRCFDIGTTTRMALDKFIRSQGTDDQPASTHILDSGNGGIMRLAPVVVYAFTHEPDNPKNIPDPIRNYAMMLAHEQSSTTHASDECLRIARIMARDLTWIVGGNTWDVVTRYIGVEHLDHRDKVESDGYVKNTWQAACWVMDNTDNFRDALLLAVNLGYDADTVGAVTGQLAGACYGYDAIPKEWLDVLAMKPYLEELFDKLCEA